MRIEIGGENTKLPYVEGLKKQMKAISGYGVR